MQTWTAVLVGAGVGLVGVAVVGGGVWAILALRRRREEPEGAPCIVNAVCGANQVCKNGTCIDKQCNISADCSAGQVCVDNLCGPCTGVNDCALPKVCTNGVCSEPPRFLFFTLTFTGEDGQQYALSASGINSIPRRMLRKSPDINDPAQQLVWGTEYWPGTNKRQITSLAYPDLRMDGNFDWLNYQRAGLTTPNSAEMGQFWVLDPVSKNLQVNLAVIPFVYTLCRFKSTTDYELAITNWTPIPSNMVKIEFTYTEYYDS